WYSLAGLLGEMWNRRQHLPRPAKQHDKREAQPADHGDRPGNRGETVGSRTVERGVRDCRAGRRAEGRQRDEHQCESEPADERCAPQLAQDRKSTRLNSSHVSISYAVFCLKKKNEKF